MSRPSRFRSLIKSFSLVWIGPLVVDQIRELVEESEIMREDDEKWPRKNVVGRQELEIRLGNEHISFEVGGGRA